MPGDDFNKELDSYIHQRRKRYTGHQVMPKKESEKKPMEEPVEEPMPGMIEDEYNTATKKQGFFARLFGSEKKEKAEAPAEPEVHEETRELGKIALRILRKMPADQLKVFKETEDFKKFKEILQKHQVIK